MGQVDQIRQGDVFFELVDRIPKKARPVNTRVVATGELTGHAHMLTEGSGATLLLDDKDGMFVDASQGGSVVHEEHPTVELDGTYKITRQREYDPVAAERERKVAD